MNYFDNGLGITADSIDYYRDHRHELGTILVAEVAFPGLSDHYPYCFELRDDRGPIHLLDAVGPRRQQNRESLLLGQFIRDRNRPVGIAHRCEH